MTAHVIQVLPYVRGCSSLASESSLVRDGMVMRAKGPKVADPCADLHHRSSNAIVAVTTAELCGEVRGLEVGGKAQQSEI